ncbi:MAG: hypothetical protein QOJ65_252 [Fimbriimonadaceae bacterium]|jgi:hypothetical protein|nr:hypothetical protein [Fimbriimonadaceae bacterium]
MSHSGITTIQCPKCHRSLPPAATNCHFCGADLAAVPRPKAVAKKKKGPEQWVMTLYYVVACFWIVDGGWSLTSGMMRLLRPSDSALRGMEFVSIFGMAIGAFSALLGLGLLLKWNWARGVVNIFCWLRIAQGVLSLPSLATIGIFLGTGMMIFSIIFTVFGIAVAGLQIWLISETEDQF